MSIEISQCKRKNGIFNIRSPFSNAIISFYFSIRGLLKSPLIFPCHIMFLIIIVLHLLFCGILNLTPLTKSFVCIYKFHILYSYLITPYLIIPYLISISYNSISYIGFYSLTIYFTWRFAIRKSFWVVM